MIMVCKGDLWSDFQKRHWLLKTFQVTEEAVQDCNARLDVYVLYREVARGPILNGNCTITCFSWDGVKFDHFVIDFHS